MRGRGSLSAMVVCLVPSMFLLAALVIDGGRLVVSYQRASDAAAIAARDGAQEIVGIMEGSPHVDVVAADRTATLRIGQLGFHGTARATRDRVEVTARQRVDLPLLALVGIGTGTVNVTRTADVVVG